MSGSTTPDPGLAMGTPAGRWVVTAAVLGSGIAFLDGTVVNAALPAIARDLDAGLADLQWVLSGYLLTLGSFLVLGGSLGDRFGRRRVFQIGLGAFALSSLLCGIAPTATFLIVARAVQGVAAALLVPGSLAIISASFRRADRGRAIGAWSGLGGVAAAVGPFLGGWLIDTVSWRAVFLINLPLAAVTIALTARHVPETRDRDARGRIDGAGALTLSVGLAGVVYGLIEGPAGGWTPPAVVALVVGLLCLAGFVLVERVVDAPMVPLEVFANRQFSGANAVTFVVYAALGAVTFLLVVHLQTNLGYSALEAGAALLPITILMLAFSARVGAWAQRNGPRVPMTVGPVVVGLGMVLLAAAEPGRSYWAGVLPGATVLGIGLTITVAPLTATVLAAVEDRHAGVGSAVNNAVARIASLLAIAVLPAVAGITTTGGASLDAGYPRAMVIAGVIAACGGILAAATIRRGAAVQVITKALPGIPCDDPCLELTTAGRSDGVR